MCVGGSAPSAPAPPPRLPEAPQAPPASNVQDGASSADIRRRRAAAGLTGTILTGPRGIQNGATTGVKNLLGE